MMAEGMNAAVGSATGADASAAADTAVAHVSDQLGGETPTLVVAFLGGAYTDQAVEVADRLREGLAPDHMIGTTAGGVIADEHEFEQPAALSVWAARLPGATITPLRYAAPSEGADEADVGMPGLGTEWPEPPAEAAALLMFADPAGFPAPGFLAWLNQAHPGLPVSGGMASAAAHPGGNRLLLDDAVFDDGAVALALEGVRVRTLVSQGCSPVGSSYVVTAAEENILQELGGEPPVQRLRAIFDAASPEEQRRMQSGLHIGAAIDEYREAFDRGDFLVRPVLGAQPDTDAIVVGDLLQVGQTVQFHVRDAPSADEDLRRLLADFAAQGSASAGLLFTCNGRGQNLFNEPDHDAGLVRSALGDVPLAGFFCAGEFGPVGPHSYVHGFTASLLAFEPASDSAEA